MNRKISFVCQYLSDYSIKMTQKPMITSSFQKKGFISDVNFIVVSFLLIFLDATN
jgi:hypothetical protein